MGYYDLHESWRRVIDMYGTISGLHYGGSVVDVRCGKSWDPGQAVMAEVFGPDWPNSPEWKELNETSEDSVCPDYIIEAAQRIIDGEVDWITSRRKEK